jgi:eukaryotic-like serine/threonine-protein kinase
MMNAGRIPLEPGHRLDRYELLCPIAHGGMASVWLARFVGKHGFEKLVAVKTILPEFASDTRFQQMFLDEARIASGIEHVNVAQILDLGEQHDVLYIVMEWVDGDSLSKLHRSVEARGDRVPLGVTLRLLADACGGLHAAHELTDKAGKLLGVVHRDVSPQNILVSTRGNAKLIDFGIVKALDRISGDTNAGLLKGKIQYMAPEQSRGGGLDRRADVWAAGAVLYYLLSGRPPYDGENQLATLHMLTSGQPPPPLPDDVPPPVRDLVFRALAHHAHDRTASAADLQRQLEHAMLLCGVYTTSTDVAAFVAKELGSRAEARKQAIDISLAAAAERAGLHVQAGQTGVAPMPTHSSPPAGSTSSSGSGNGSRPISANGSPLASTVASQSGNGHVGSSPGAARAPQLATLPTAPFQVGAEATMLAPAPGDHPMPPRSPLAETMLAPHGSADPISQVSNATLGAAAVAYPQNSRPPPQLAKKGSGGAWLGGLLLVGLLFGGGAFAYKHPELRAKILHTGSPATSQQDSVAANPNNTITSETPVIPAPIDSALPTANANPPLIPSAVPPATASATASAAPSASIAAKTNPPTTSTKSSAHDSSAHDSNHTTAKPATKPPSGSHSTDYGF